MKRIVSFLMIMALCASLLLTGCTDKEVAKYDYTLYELNTDGTSLVEVGYNTKTTDQDDLIVELINQLYIGSEDADYMNSIPSNVVLSDYRIKSQLLTVSWSREYAELSGAQEVLVRAAIVKTLLQVKGIYSINFEIEGEPLKDVNGSVIGVMDSDTFISSFGQNSETLQSTNLILYYASKDGQTLISEERDVMYNSNTPIGRVVLEYLGMAPETEGAVPTLSDNTTVISLAVSDGVCYVTLDSSFLSQDESLPQNIVIYSIVNSLTEIDGISKVKLTVEGSSNDVALQLQQVDGVYERDLSYLATPE